MISVLSETQSNKNIQRERERKKRQYFQNYFQICVSICVLVLCTNNLFVIMKLDDQLRMRRGISLNVV